MTKSDFKQALLRGQGRCILAVRENPEKYRDLVMWACSRGIAFDPQCEGARTWFVYQLAHCYEDVRPFIQTAAQSLRKCRPNGDWTIFSLSELLGFFAQDGSSAARRALEDKYQQLYATLLERKRLPKGIFPERDDFHQLCVVLAVNQQAFLKIAGDIGRLYRLRPFYDGFDFDWLYEAKGKRYLNALRKGAETSEDLACYLEKQQDCERELENRRKERTQSLPLPRNMDSETAARYARNYLAQTEPLARAEALQVFRRCLFPEDPSPILADAEADSEALREAAWKALENIRHPLVRDFAIAKQHEDPVGSIALLAKNYQPQDAALLEGLVTAIPAAFEDTTGWHMAGLDVLGMADDGLKAPPSLLRYIYETTYCSCCREYALRQMGKRHMLSQEMLEECLYDSNSDIRTYARRILNRRKGTSQTRG